MEQQQRYRSINLQQHPANNFGGGGMPNQQYQPNMGQPGPYRQQNMNQLGPGGMRGPQQMGPGMGGPMRSPNPGQSPRGPMGGMAGHTPPHQYQSNMAGMPARGGSGNDSDVNGSSHNVMMNNVM